jgi:mRNA-degrading endonuclease toxin of MazEF toxin-antitoxin module
MIVQGGVYLVNFAKTYHSELGKIRPAVVIQDNFLNRSRLLRRLKLLL